MELFRKKTAIVEKITYLCAMNAKDQNVSYTFYRLGPDFITWFYPIDTTPIDQEILDPNGQIGLEYYEDIPGAVEHLKPFDSHWFMQEENEEALGILREDLVFLSTVFGMIGAHSLLAQLVGSAEERLFQYKLGAEGGSPECMVGFGQMMCLKNHVSDGWQWIEKGAEKGCEMGMLLAGISYQYGTLSEIDYKKAAYFYRRAIKEFHNFFAFINYGVMLVDANCCHTALYTFGHAMKRSESQMQLLKRKGMTNILNNIDSCEALLQLPYEVRPKHIAFEHYSPELDSSFCQKGESPRPVGAYGQKPQPWQPDNSRMVPKDIEERDNYLAKIKSREVMMEIDEKYRIFLKYDDGTPIAEVKMPALPKALYFVFLNHPEGFPLKHLVDYRDELLSWYRKLSNRYNIDKSIDDLTDPTKNSANEKISRIGKAFRDAIENCDDSIDTFIPIGSKGEVYAVLVDRERIMKVIQSHFK